MEGAMTLLLFSAFLVIVIYRMDQNEKKKSNTDEESAYRMGFHDGMMWSPESLETGRQRADKVKSIMKRKK